MAKYIDRRHAYRLFEQSLRNQAYDCWSKDDREQGGEDEEHEGKDDLDGGLIGSFLRALSSQNAHLIGLDAQHLSNRRA